ncbi:MAG: LysE family transporter [Dehalococcoidia bacterium]|nr:LysE family transporter [Dehalococcoidia bacterium]MDZ4246097.1 LysE family transporter [Dehalococcoidia bacterium]
MPEPTLSLIFTTSFVIALSGAMMPGPLLAVTISEVARRGFWAGPLLVLGHAILELSIVAALAFGLSRLVGSELISGIIFLAGGIPGIKIYSPGTPPR